MVADLGVDLGELARLAEVDVLLLDGHHGAGLGRDRPHRVTGDDRGTQGRRRRGRRREEAAEDEGDDDQGDHDHDDGRGTRRRQTGPDSSYHVWLLPSFPVAAVGTAR